MNIQEHLNTARRKGEMEFFIEQRKEDRSSYTGHRWRRPASGWSNNHPCPGGLAELFGFS